MGRDRWLMRVVTALAVLVIAGSATAAALVWQRGDPEPPREAPEPPPVTVRVSVPHIETAQSEDPL